MVKRIFKVGLCSVLATNLVMSSTFYTKVLKPIGVREVYVVSHASTMAPPPAPSLRPIDEAQEDTGTLIDEADKNLPFESDFIESVSYNNKYGYLLLNINKDFLSESFVNEIQYIGINDKKYKYETVNNDRSRWYTIFIPYKYKYLDTSKSKKSTDKVFSKNWKKLPNGKWTIVGEKSSWVKDGNKWFYPDSNGLLVENDWITTSGKWHYLKAGGYMAENERVSYKNKWYYAGSDGAIVTDKWESINGKDYYFNSSGDLLVNTVVDGYNVDANGVKIK